MSIRHGLLSLLAQGPRHGYQLRADFDSSTGSTWPLNVGQVYTTLSRLDRDGLVRAAGEDEGRLLYEITDRGREELRRWFATPVVHRDRPRDELVIKLAMAVAAPGVEVPRVVQTQRIATLRELQDLTRLKLRSAESDPAERAWLLVLEAMIFQAEAEVRWLDHCEAYVTALAAERPVAATEDEGRGATARGVEGRLRP